MGMIGLQSSLLKKYSKALDQFVTLRVFSGKEAHKLFQSTVVTNRKEYVTLVLNACVVGFSDSLSPSIMRMENYAQVLDDLYALCVGVNPFLDISKISLPVAEETSILHLVEPKSPSVDIETKIKGVRNALKSSIVGQDHAIDVIDKALKKAYLGLRNLTRPVAVFLFLGSTGVGKTELAKVLSSTLYGSSSRLLRVNCSEYALSHEYAKLLGAPPGYVGYDEGGVLSNCLLNTPDVVMLFDEIEKADGKLHNLLLQVMDDGMAHDSKGRVLDFTKSIIVLTSNIGGNQIAEIEKKIGFIKPSLDHEKVVSASKEALKDVFRPEFLNRISNVVVFRNLNIEDCRKIAGKFIDEIAAYAGRIPITFTYTDDVKCFVADAGFSPEYGAREIRRTADKFILHPLSEQIIEKKIRAGDKVRAKVRKGRICFSVN